MAERLDIMEQADGSCYLAWIIDGDEGSAVGPELAFDEESKAINAALAPLADETTSRAFLFMTKAKAKEALRTARAVIRSHKAAKPWPEWAITASAQGWKAPKGWAP